MSDAFAAGSYAGLCSLRRQRGKGPIAARNKQHALLAALLGHARRPCSRRARRSGAGGEGRSPASNLLRVLPAAARRVSFEGHLVARRRPRPQIWCAAAEYAQARTRPGFQPPHVHHPARAPRSAPNEPPRKGVACSLAPGPDLLGGPTPNNSGLTLSVTRRGFNLSVNHANAMCGAFRDTPDCPAPPLNLVRAPCRLIWRRQFCPTQNLAAGL
ncbi:MAG: hypothetical protein U5K36_01640 [Roseovarius sp.]|nr:hypothetical protein [Roseovarius sp.]